MKEASEVFEELKSYLKKHVNSYVPGYLSSLDRMAHMVAGSSFLDLLFSQPSKAYEVLKLYYRSEYTADFAMVTLFLKPIAIKLGEVGLEDTLFKLVKEGRDREFIEFIVKKAMKRS